MFQVFTGSYPFAAKKNDSSVIFAILDGKRPELPLYIETNKVLANLVQHCWDQIPSNRPSADEVCKSLKPVCL
jgi:hypothetical protein